MFPSECLNVVRGGYELGPDRSRSNPPWDGCYAFRLVRLTLCGTDHESKRGQRPPWTRAEPL